MMWRVELHSHTNFSHDSLTGRWLYLLMLKLKKVDAIAITDHNTIEGALIFRDFLKRFGIQVIIGEEVMTSEGEVIGLFLQHTIPPHMTAAETMAAIKAQAGIVYIPHPYDEKRYRTVISQRALDENKAHIDIIEVHNGRNVKSFFSNKQLQIARRYPHVIHAIGSDAHTFFELGRNVQLMPAFTTKEKFLHALREATFIKKDCIQLAHTVTKCVRVLKKQHVSGATMLKATETKQNEPLISVIIPTYNRAQHLRDAIDSVLAQTYPNIELIVVDDGSTDETEHMIAQLAEPIHYIKLSENSKGRLPRNIGLAESNGTFIAFLDSDDVWLPTKLEKQLRYVQDRAQNAQNVLCFTDCIIDKGTRKLVKKNKPLKRAQPILDYILAEQNVVQTSTYFVSAALAKRVQFNAQLTKHQDWDFCMRLEQAGAEFLHCPIAETIWRSEDYRQRISTSQTNAASFVWFEANQANMSKRAQAGFQAEIFLASWVRESQYRAIFSTLLHFWNAPIYLLKKCARTLLYKVPVKND